jgi:membrane protein implicated in regulation of membrane protease activity
MDMTEWWASLSLAQQIFHVIAVVTTIVLLVQLILNLVGLAGHDTDVDTAGGDMPADVSVDHPGDTGHSTGLGILSIRSVTAFFVGFGWGGVVMLRSGVALPITIVVAFIIGAAFLLTVFYLMKSILKLSESGNIQVRNAVGQSGTVYITVPAANKGKGQIQVKVQGRLREVEAVTDAEDDLAVGTPVSVIKVIGDSTMLVRKMEAK